MDKILQKKDLGKFVGYLKKDYEVVGPKRKAEGYIFDYIDDPAELALDYTTTMLPPKLYRPVSLAVKRFASVPPPVTRTPCPTLYWHCVELTSLLFAPRARVRPLPPLFRAVIRI